MEELRVSQRLFNSMDYWIKFTKYDIFEFEDELYIRPEKNARLEGYSPQDKSPQILRDLLYLAESMAKKSTDYDRAKEIVRFANKYGLLGLHDLWVSFFTDKRKYKSDTEIKDRNLKYNNALEKLNNVEYDKNKYKNYVEYLNEKTKALDELITVPEIMEYERAVVLKTHNPFGSILRNSYDPESEYVDYFEWEYEGYASLFFPGSNPPFPDFYNNSEEFWKNYCEPLYAYKYLFFKAINSIYMWAIDLTEFDKGNFDLEDPYGHDGHWRGKLHKESVILSKPTWGEWLSNSILLDNIDIELKVDYNKNRSLNYSAKTLYDALCLLFIQDSVSNKQQVKKCINPNCQDWFIAKSPKAIYCSTSCGSSVRVKKFRTKGEEGK